MKITIPLLLIGAALVLAPDEASAQVLVFSGGETTYGWAPNYPQIFAYDSLEDDTLFFGSYGTTPEDDADRDYLYWADFDDVGGTPHDGPGALWLDWQVFTDADWGGSSALQHFLPDTLEDGTLRSEPQHFYDFSDFTHIDLWYNTIVPASGLGAQFRLKLHDASEGLGTAPSSETEDWYSQDDVMYNAQPGWNVFRIPLEDLGPVTPGMGGFSRPGCPSSCWSGIWGNGELDLDMISGFQLEFTTPQQGAVNDSIVSGTIVWDNFYAWGTRYNQLESFDAGADGHWSNTTAGSYAVSTSADTAAGTGSLQVDYNIVGDQGWGGSVDIQGLPDGTDYGPMAQRTHLSLFYKVLTPASDAVTVTVKLWETSDGNREEWHWSSGSIAGDMSGKWRRALMDFNDFAIPSWLTTHDGVLNPSKIVETQIQLVVNEGTTSSGSILFDRFTGYGFQETDFEAPAAVEDFSVVASEMSNIISWTDVPNEDDEEYDVYFSYSPISDITAEGVMDVALGVPGGEQVVIHDLYAPVSDQDVTVYYAITATDRVGNTNEPTIFGSGVTNMAKGIPTISLSPPASFVADGDLSEWGGITPIHLEDGTDFGYVPPVGPPYVVSSAQDLSADVYLAIDAEGIYFAYDVTDDLYYGSEDLTANRWNYDGAEMMIGLYDQRSVKHGSYNRDTAPDYKFNIFSDDVQLDFEGGITLYTNGSENYSFTTKTGGYVIEGKFLYADFHYMGAPAEFVPLNGMRVPLDLVLQDNDTGAEARQGYMAYSYDNQDDSYLSPSNWFYTWIGDQIQVGVEDVTTDLPTEYALRPNYPNPFNPTTLFRYDLKEAGPVTLRVFNLLGQEVRTLVDTDQAAGTYEVTFDASQLASGVYIYQLRSGSFVRTRKMMLVR